MMKLQGPTEPFDLSLLHGMTLRVKPRSDFDLRVAQAYARQKLDELEGAAGLCMDAGLLPDGIVADLRDEHQRSALFEVFLIQKMAELVVLSWDGFYDQHDQPVPVTPETIRGAMSIWPPGWGCSIGALFWSQYMKAHAEADAAKKDLAISARGISSPAGVANIVTDAPKTTLPAPTEKRVWRDGFVRTVNLLRGRRKKSSLSIF